MIDSLKTDHYLFIYNNKKNYGYFKKDMGIY